MANTDEQRKPPDGTYAVDIRVFLACITLAMAASFIVGVGLGPASTVIEDIPKAEVVKDSYSELTKEEIKKIAEEHRPSGQHLLVDIEGVEEAFLNSEERLSKAMVDTVQEAGLTMLSYHCHSLIPSGVSCVGVLLESHISFHTWPSEGVITLDLFTCGSKPLLPAVKTLERLFGIGESPRTQWSHELRGFRNEEEKKGHYLDDSSDLSLWVLSPLEMYSKDQIYSNLTKFQRVDIWDIREVRSRVPFLSVNICRSFLNSFFLHLLTLNRSLIPRRTKTFSSTTCPQETLACSLPNTQRLTVSSSWTGQSRVRGCQK